MIFDGFFISKLVDELNHELKKFRLERIYQTEEQAFVFVFYGLGKRKQLSLKLSASGFGVYITQKDERTGLSSQFFNSLKKHLDGAILNEISQHLTDRVMLFSFTQYDMLLGPIEKTLVFEAMGRHSNLILVQDGIIMDTFKKMFFETGRQLLPQANFSFFPSDKRAFHEMNFDDVNDPLDLVNRYLGISPILAAYLFETGKKPRDLELCPTRNLTLNKDYAADIFPHDHEKRYFQSLSEMMDETGQTKHPKFQSILHFLTRQREKVDKKILQTESLQEDNLKRLKDKEKADWIYQSMLDLKSTHSSIQMGDEWLQLDPTKTLNEHDQSFYKSYHKAKKGLVYLENMLADYREQRDYLDSLSDYVAITSQDSLADLEKELVPFGYKKAKTKQPGKKTNQKPKIMKLEDEDATYWIGKNNVQNAYLTHEFAQKDDMWFHVKEATGAHVIVRTHRLTESVIRKAASLAAYFSKLKDSSSIPVDYTKVSMIKKIPKLSIYKVTYKNHHTIFIDLDLDAMKKMVGS